MDVYFKIKNVLNGIVVIIYYVMMLYMQINQYVN